MQLYYTVRQIHYLRNIRNALDNYYDSDMDGLLNWMQYSIIILALMAAAIPAMIFGHGWWLALFAIFCFIGIFYLGDNFCHYAVSTVYTVEEVKSEKSNSDNLDTVIPAPEGTQEGISQQTMDRVTHAVEKWIAKGGHLKSRLYQPVAASEIGVPKYLLAGWLSQQGLKYNDWLSNLRIEEAKRLIQEHPGWNNDTIAQECGFTDRSQFQKKFKERVKCSPTEFLAANSRKHL
jgi:AraC-like DNA-binding protein